MSYFSKLWNKWFGRKPSPTVSSKSTISAPSVTSTVAVVETTPVPAATKTKKMSASTVARDQGNSYYDESPSGIDPLTVAVAVSVLNDNSERDYVPAPEPSSHFAPYESNVGGCETPSAPVESHSHVDSGYTHQDSGYSHSDYGSSSYDSGSSSYDSGSSSYDSGGGGFGGGD